MKSRSIRRVLFYLLLAGSLAGFFTWLLHVPRRPERLLRAVPVHADYLSIHPNLADQWAGLSANPIFRSVLGGMGFGKDELDAAASDPGFQTWMRMLASDTLVLFRADNWRPGERRPVWCAASLLGGRSQRLRWLLKAGRIPGFERAGEYQGRILWRWQSRDLPPGADLYLAFEEGLVLACLTDRASDLAALLSSYDGTSPSCDFSAMGLNWDQLPPMTGRVRSGLDWEFRVDEIGSDRLAARLICRTPLPPLTPVRTPAPPEWISVAADG
ncbi:MAG: hypothetical protein U1E27_13705, partial [Kiritimatiellia bacterium]|nr:hypothetical protein [Kiritimatiellia bacterium]